MDDGCLGELRNLRRIAADCGGFAPKKSMSYLSKMRLEWSILGEMDHVYFWRRVITMRSLGSLCDFRKMSGQNYIKNGASTLDFLLIFCIQLDKHLESAVHRFYGFS